MKFNLKSSAGILVLSVFFLNTFCSNKVDEEVKKEHEISFPFSSQFSMSDLQISEEFTPEGKTIGQVEILEASGLAASRVNVDGMWTHNDSGNENVLYLIDKSTGKTKAGYLLNGIENIDWEDIEVGPGPDAGKSYIYLGDIGDNNGILQTRTIYRFEEPVFADAHQGTVVDWSEAFDALHYIYSDGARDAETLLLDHKTKDLYVLSKRDYPARLYLFPYPQNKDDVTSLKLAGTLPLFIPVGGNVSSEGDEILIKTYQSIFLWRHNPEQPIWKTLAATPEIAPYDPVEPQGEAIGFDQNRGYYTLSERVGDEDATLYFYQRLK